MSEPVIPKYCKDCGQVLAPAEGDGRCWNCHQDYEKMLELQKKLEPVTMATAKLVIPERYALDYRTLSDAPVPSETWEWDRQRHVAMGQFAKKLLEELGAAETTLAESQKQTKDAWTNRDHFCHWINEIARLFWGNDKHCYSPEATFAMVQKLQQQVTQQADTITKARKYLNEIHIVCACYDWMGGCKRESGCSRGYLKRAKEALASAGKERP